MQCSLSGSYSRVSIPSFNGKDNQVVFESEARQAHGSSVDLVCRGVDGALYIRIALRFNIQCTLLLYYQSKNFKTIQLNDVRLPVGFISMFHISIQLLESGVFGMYLAVWVVCLRVLDCFRRQVEQINIYMFHNINAIYISRFLQAITA